MIINDYDNCTVGSVMGTGMVHVGGLCMNQVITLFLGLDRIYALFWPFKYRLKNQATIARFVAAFGIFMGRRTFIGVTGYTLARPHPLLPQLRV
jgi:hypothetical protein